MPVLERSELEASPLADLHAIADQLGLEGFRRLRKADLIDTILGRPDAEGKGSDCAVDAPSTKDDDRDGDDQREDAGSAGSGRSSRRRRPARSRRVKAEGSAEGESGAKSRRGQSAEGAAEGGRATEGGRAAEGGRVAEGVIELLGNGSAFVRVDPPEASDEDVYISAAQVRRCELVSGDRVTGPVRMPRRSERYPSLVRVETINGAPAGEVSEGTRYDERPAAYPSEHISLGGADAVLEAIEWLTPFGQGSRVLIAGPARSGKTELVRRLLTALSGREGLEVTLALAGVRPEEITEWHDGDVAPAVALGFAASSDAQGQAVEHAIETAKRTAARGGNALVLIDTLDGLHPHAARKVLAAARNLRDGGSLTIIATASHPIGGETTVIALDPELAGAEGPPLDLIHSGTLRAELLVGEDGAKAIADARVRAVAQARGD